LDTVKLFETFKFVLHSVLSSSQYHKTAGSFKTLVPLCQKTQCHNPEGSSLKSPWS